MYNIRTGRTLGPSLSISFGDGLMDLGDAMSP